MASYAIGDLQGCLDPLKRLLARLAFDPARDRLLFTGDLVNRGPQSLPALRYVRALGKAAVTVLGNHDLHLLAAARSGRFKGRDTLGELMAAPDRDELLAWLRERPLAYQDPASGALLVHAGVAPQWTARKLLALAAETAEVLNGKGGARFFENMYGDEPVRWSERLRGAARTRFVINCLTRLRYCTAKGDIDLKHKGPPGSQPARLLPWFEAPGRKTAADTIVFGHWSSLGQVRWQDGRIWGLDTGCVWGGCLTALNLATGETIKTDCTQYQKPDKGEG
ncbi:MAG TPA: symmetrical bis(5'-nucleosyl)-tetraphosphatase [Solimonas sp.]|nr:symmetrical bis(5'-nucleosyl)-tetraphosphatase [Solimonas sp.]